MNGFGQTPFYFFGKINHHIFAGGLVINQNNMMSSVAEFFGQRNVWRCLIKHRRVIKLIDDLFFDNFFQIAKINHHPKLYVVAIGNGCANYGNRKLVAVPMHIFAFAVVAIQGVAGLKAELFGDANLTHGS